MVVKAIYCKECGQILYSLAQHHYNSCKCGNVAIDGMGERISFADKNRFVNLQLDGEFMLHNLMQNACARNGRLEIDLGTFKIHEQSNEKFYKYLVLNWDEFEADFTHFKKFGKWQHLSREIKAKKGLVE